MVYKNLLKPLLFNMEAEKAHDFTYGFAQKASDSDVLKFLIKVLYNYQSRELIQNFWGLTFRNPIGLAAGFDKNGHIAEAIEAIGAGFTEVGSITANPSTGNAKPRSFRLPKDQALINRMGLNNDGAKTIIKRLKNTSLSLPLGVNIAKTHDPAIMGDKAIEDYLFSFKEAREVADYITINISCPNTSSKREALQTDAGVLKEIGQGGLSGLPIHQKSVQLVKWISEETKGQKPIIGVGGINSFDHALDMLKAGADLLQIYTGFIYEGPGLIKKINKKLVRYLQARQADSLLQLPTHNY